MIICRKDAKAQRKAQENKNPETFASLRLCGKRYYSGFSYFVFHSRRVLSRLPETSKEPSGENARDWT